ncbi:MAG: PD-(D/E)XK nuclease family protein [Pyrinomonadaceae bacterium]
MKWSFSENLTLKECPRQWYFSYKLANSKTSVPIRKEAFYLSKLRTIQSWRGELVDRVISDYIIPSIRVSTLSLDDVLEEARRLFEKQLSFARQQTWRSPDIKTTHKYYLALRELEEGKDITDELAQAWEDIETALRNFFSMDELWEILRKATVLKPQERLGFRHYDIWVTCQPDLIAFFPDDQPALFDWKVHRYGVKEYRTQLALYALALTQSSLKLSYPELAKVKPYLIPVYEVQLLTNKLHRYDLEDYEVDEIKSMISSSARRMQIIIDPKNEVTSYLDIPTTAYPDKCLNCNFDPICREGSRWQEKIEWQEPKQTSLLF